MLNKVKRFLKQVVSLHGMRYSRVRRVENAHKGEASGEFLYNESTARNSPPAVLYHPGPNILIYRGSSCFCKCFMPFGDRLRQGIQCLEILFTGQTLAQHGSEGFGL